MLEHPPLSLPRRLTSLMIDQGGGVIYREWMDWVSLLVPSFFSFLLSPSLSSSPLLLLFPRLYISPLLLYFLPFSSSFLFSLLIFLLLVFYFTSYYLAIFRSYSHTLFFFPSSSVFTRLFYRPLSSFILLHSTQLNSTLYPHPKSELRTFQKRDFQSPSYITIKAASKCYPHYQKKSHIDTCTFPSINPIQSSHILLDKAFSPAFFPFRIQHYVSQTDSAKTTQPINRP